MDCNSRAAYQMDGSDGVWYQSSSLDPVGAPTVHQRPRLAQHIKKKGAKSARRTKLDCSHRSIRKASEWNAGTAAASPPPRMVLT